MHLLLSIASLVLLYLVSFASAVSMSLFAPCSRVGRVDVSQHSTTASIAFDDHAGPFLYILQQEETTKGVSFWQVVFGELGKIRPRSDSGISRASWRGVRFP